MSDENLCVKCNNCGKKYKARNPAESIQYRCSGCGHTIIVKPVLFDTKIYKKQFSGINYDRGLKRLAIALILIAPLFLLVGFFSMEENPGGFFLWVSGILILLSLIIWIYLLIRFVIKGFKNTD